MLPAKSQPTITRFHSMHDRNRSELETPAVQFDRLKPVEMKTRHLNLFTITTISATD